MLFLTAPFHYSQLIIVRIQRKEPLLLFLLQERTRASKTDTMQLSICTDSILTQSSQRTQADVAAECMLSPAAGA